MSRHSLARLLILAVFLLNIADAVLTAIMVPARYAIEVNPIASYFLQQGVPQFLIFKISIVGVCCAWLYHRTYKTIVMHRAVNIILGILTVGYGLVVLNGLVWWNLAMLGKLQRIGG